MLRRHVLADGLRFNWLSSNKDHCSLILKDLLPTTVLPQQTGKRNIRLNQHGADSIFIQRITPPRLTIMYVEPIFDESVAINVSAAIDEDSILWVQPPNQIATPGVLIVNGLSWLSLDHEVDCCCRKLA